MGLIYVPGSTVIALVKSPTQKTELRVPYLPLVTNDWFGREKTITFLENACIRGSFKSAYSQLLKGECPKVMNANISGAANATTTYFIPLDDVLEFAGETEKIYN